MALGRVFPNEIDRIFNAPGGTIGREVRKVSLRTARNAEILARQKLGKHPGDRQRTGRYQRSFQVKVLGRSTEFQVLNTAPYAAALEQGGRPHAIRAKKTSYLKFRGRDGRWRTVKMVRHPGNPAYRILETAAILAVRQEYGSVRVY
jgi:hypothetical protein